MNIKQFIEKAKKVLREDAGSEGFCYILKYKGSLKVEGFIVEETKIENGEKCAKIKFDVPQDYGCALNLLKELTEVISLELIF